MSSLSVRDLPGDGSPSKAVGYSAVILSSLTEDQNVPLSAAKELLEANVLRDQTFLDWLSEGRNPTVLCTRHGSAPADIAAAKDLAIFPNPCPPQGDIFRDQLLLGSLNFAWTPRLICVRQGNAVVGVICVKDRQVFRGIRIWYVDFAFGSMLRGDPAEQQRILGAALEAILASAGTRGIRVIAQPRSPELAAIRGLVASRRLDCRFRRLKGHAVLCLPSTYEKLLKGFGKTTRRNFVYYRRRFETGGHQYLENLSIEELRLAALKLKPKCSRQLTSDSIERLLDTSATTDRPLAVGLKHANGDWLSVICGVHTHTATVILLQLNNDRDFPQDSLSVVLRAYLIESLIRQGAKDVVFWGGVAPPLSRYVSYMPALAVAIDSPEYKWRLVRGLKFVVMSSWRKS